MRIQKIKIHNFRSIKEQEVTLGDYSILLGENNAGKTNVIRALRIFYENDLKFDSKVDFPKFKTDDQESWIEIDFLTTADEQANLKNEYKSADNILKVRKFLKSDDKERVKANQSNIFGYENGVLSSNLFYGAKNISESKIGNVIYIPELSKVDDSLKMSGPSPLRDMINFVITKIAKKSASFSKLEKDFEEFNSVFKTEDTEGFSVQNLEQDINNEIKEWNIQFGLKVNPLQPNDIVKNLVSHFIKDGFLNNEEVKIDSFGQGLQRHLIYALIKLSTKYNDDIKKEKKEFSPDFTFILFEEPEAFLHPSQQEKMNTSLQLLAKDEEQQILITTHSPIFVSKNTDNIPSLIRVKRDGESQIFQLHKEQVETLFDQNTGMHQMFLDKLKDTSIDEQLKKKIRDKKLANETDDLEIKLKEESFKYFLWVDGERASSFFAKHVLICEGATEKIFLDYLTDTIWTEFKDKHIYILDALGKFNIHRYMNLFGFLGIEHSVLMDKDNDADIHKDINAFIESKKNKYTKQVKCFDEDIEGFLGIDKPSRKDQKPLSIIYKYNQKEIAGGKINALKTLFEDLFK